MAWRTIRQTRNIQKAEKRDRLLNEIIEWAIDVASIFEPTDTPDLSDDKNAADSWPFLASQRKKLNSLQLLGARSLAMCIIAENINTELKAVVENASKKHAGMEPQWLARAFLRVQDLRVLPRMVRPLTLEELRAFFFDRARELMDRLK